MDSDGHSWKSIKSWIANKYSQVRTSVKRIVTTVKKVSYNAYYKATEWHFEGRARRNGTHPSYAEAVAPNSGWTLLSPSMSIYHDNGIGNSELIFITQDGREAVFDGDTYQPVSDPRYMGTYNYVPLYQMPETGATLGDYGRVGLTAAGHFFCDMLPYYLTGNSNTREQFEQRIVLFN